MSKLVKWPNFICIVCIFIARPSYQLCLQNYKVLNWEFDDHSLPPAILTQKLTVSEANGNQTNIEVWLIDRREDFKLTLFANPFIKNEADCPRHLREHKNIRQFFKTCTVFKDHDENVSRTFSGISTGCYYFLMTNKEGKNWRLPGLFYKTNYPYINTKLELLKNTTAKPADIGRNIELRTKLRIPLDCLKVHAELYELKNEIKDPIGDINSGEIPISQECCFSKQAEGVISKQCGTSPLITNLTLDVRIIDEHDEEWTALITWKNLQSGGGKYYLHFVPKMVSCSYRYHYTTDTWRPLRKDIWILYGLEEANNSPHINPKSNDFPVIPIMSVLLIISLTLVLTYWILKYSKLMIKKARRSHEYSDKPQETISLYIEKESYEILLMYEKGSPQFMKKMRSLVDDLKLHCRDYRVHDVYGINEWNRVNELGASGWVFELLKDGSKVVWVDTPQFRSRFNDKHKQQYTAEDFRDDAIAYAVCVARDSFQNSVTQYRRHFVVRIKGFEIQDGDEDDPLRMVSPHARYHIPEHFSLLCEHLRNPMGCLNTTGDEERGFCS